MQKNAKTQKFERKILNKNIIINRTNKVTYYF